MRPNTEKIVFARVLMPTYIPAFEWTGRDGEYSPWVITHTPAEVDNGSDPALSNETLDRLYEEFLEDPGENAQADFSEFISFLEQHGYTVINVENGGVWKPV